MTHAHTVKKGDTLSSIAKQYNAEISQIGGFRSGNPELIFPGEVLNIGKKEISLNDLSNDKTSTFEDRIAEPEPIIPEFDFKGNIDEREDITSKISQLRGREQEVLTGAETRFGELVGSKEKLGTIQGQLDALKIQRQSLPLKVAERYRGRGVTEAALSNITSQELNRNAIASTDLAATGSLLQGNINTALDLIEQSVEFELAPILADLDFQESNLDRLTDIYSDEASEFNKGILNRAKVAKDAIAEERNQLNDLRDFRRDLRIIGEEARAGGASSRLVQQIYAAEDYEAALALASGYLGQDIFKLASDKRAEEAGKRAERRLKLAEEADDTFGSTSFLEELEGIIED